MDLSPAGKIVIGIDDREKSTSCDKVGVLFEYMVSRDPELMFIDVPRFRFPGLNNCDV